MEITYQLIIPKSPNTPRGLTTELVLGQDSTCDDTVRKAMHRIGTKLPGKPLNSKVFKTSKWYFTTKNTQNS